MTKQHFPAPALRRPLGASLLGASLLGMSLLGASCSGGGGGSANPGGTITPLALDFALRRALHPQGGAGSGPVIDGTVADVNGDGVPDAVLLDFGDATASVMLGDGAGGFVEAFVLSIPGVPTAVAAADVSGDGQLDLCIARLVLTVAGGVSGSTTAAVSIFEQLPEGGFGAAATSSADLPAQVLTILPIPGAGAGSDLLAVVPEAGSIHRLASIGGDLIETAVLSSSAIGLGTPLTAAALDAAGDGTLDLVVGEVSRIVIYPGDGAGGFDGPELLLAPVDVAILCCVHDADGDGLDDLSVAQLTGTEALLLRNTPGGLTELVEFELGAPATAVTYPDLDGDGLADLAAALLYEGAVEVRLADAPLSFGPGRRFEAGPAPRRIEVVDLDGDALPDLACTNGVDLAFLRNEGGGVLRSAEAFPGVELPAFVDCADLDGDGLADAVSIDLFQRAVVFHRGIGGGSMELAGEVELVESSTQHPSYLRLVDIDADGDQDVVTAVAKSGEVLILRNKGLLPFGPAAAEDHTPIGAKPLGLDVGDVDLDGDLDVVVAGSGESELEVLLMDESGHLVAQSPLALEQRPVAVALLDLDGDLDLDLLVSAGEDSGADAAVLVLEGDGLGGFALVDSIAASSIGSQIAVADLNEDGLQDAVVGLYGEISDSVLVLQNLGGLELLPEPIEVGASPGCVAVRDIDEDGSLDICVPTGTGVFQILLGDGALGFAPAPDLPAEGMSIPYGTTGSSVTDLDGDGLLDLALLSPLYRSLWIVRNESTEMPPAP